MNIKYFGVSRADGEILLKSIPDKSHKAEITKEASKVFPKMKSFNLNPEERQKVSSKNGNWFMKRDENDLLYLLLTDKEYPERHAYGLIQTLQDSATKLDSDSFVSDSKLKATIKPVMKENVEKYQDLAGIDKIAKANASVEEVRVQMENNLKKVMDNQPSLDNLQIKAENMKMNAHEFNTNAAELKKIMFMRNLKLKVILGLTVTAVGAYIIVPLVA